MVVLQPLIVAAVLWWISTGAILWLVRRHASSFGASLALGGVVAAAAVGGLWLSADDASANGAYLAFGCALAVWGWHEMGFLMGKLTGPRRAPCPAEATGWRRFAVSAQTVIHHEIALALTAVLFVALAWGQPNQTGTLTFLLLFGMRLSTKLNIFLGVPNPPVDLLPRGLSYLATYFRRARFNALFPVSLAASIVITILLAEAALTSTGGQRTGYILMLSLAALGLLEHGFLMLPRSHSRAPESALWAWALGPQTLSEFRSSPRKRGPGALGHDKPSSNLNARSTRPASQEDWVPAFAGMSGVWKSEDSASSQTPPNHVGLNESDR